MAELIVILVLLLLLGGLITGIVLWATSGRAGASTEMSCGACGYAVRGLTQLNCPECGADLREAGIIRGSSPGRRVTGMVLTLGCSFILLMGCGSSIFLFSLSSNVSSTPAQPSIQKTPAPAQQSQGGSTSSDPNDVTDGETEQPSPEPTP